MKRRFSLIPYLCICILFFGCTSNISTKDNNHNTISETTAIMEVVKIMPGFPTNTSDTIIKKLSIGGPPGTTTDVSFTTSIEESSSDVYIVTLTKDWGITVNGQYVKSSWKYRVSPNKVTLLKKIDNDNLVNMIK